MITVYVRHYLNDAGIEHVTSEWFPLVMSYMCTQEGFVSFTNDTTLNKDDCVNLTVTFVDEQAIENWIAHPEHDNVVNALDTYRSRNYWEAARTEDQSQDRNGIEWARIEATE